jgi:hypothetical protein
MPGGGEIQSARQVKESGLAASAAPHHGYESAGADLQRNIVEGLHPFAGVGVFLAGVIKPKQGRGRLGPFLQKFSRVRDRLRAYLAHSLLDTTRAANAAKKWRNASLNQNYRRPAPLSAIPFCS